MHLEKLRITLGGSFLKEDHLGGSGFNKSIFKVNCLICFYLSELYWYQRHYCFNSTVCLDEGALLWAPQSPGKQGRPDW